MPHIAVSSSHRGELQRPSLTARDGAPRACGASHVGSVLSQAVTRLVCPARNARAGGRSPAESFEIPHLVTRGIWDRGSGIWGGNRTLDPKSQLPDPARVWRYRRSGLLDCPVAARADRTPSFDALC